MWVELNRKQHQSKTLDFNLLVVFQSHEFTPNRSVPSEVGRSEMCTSTRDNKSRKNSALQYNSRKGQVVCNAARARGVRDRKGTPGSRKENAA